jgi:hypothetical protein
VPGETNGWNVVEAEDVVDKKDHDVNGGSGDTATLEKHRIQQEHSSEPLLSIPREDTQASSVEKGVKEDSAGIDDSTQVDVEKTHTTKMEGLELGD